jgi:hypothetical protein
MMKFAKKLSAAGELVAAEGLSGPDQAKRVRADASGEPITDGVFPRPRSSWRAIDHLNHSELLLDTMSSKRPVLRLTYERAPTSGCDIERSIK